MRLTDEVRAKALQVLDQQRGLLQCGIVAAAWHLGPARDVVEALYVGAGQPGEEFGGKQRRGRRDLDPFAVR